MSCGAVVTPATAKASVINIIANIFFIFLRSPNGSGKVNCFGVIVNHLDPVLRWDYYVFGNQNKSMSPHPVKRGQFRAGEMGILAYN
jgi:hypothetical protein